LLPVQQTVSEHVYEANATGDMTTVTTVSPVTLHGTHDVQQVCIV